MQTLNLQARDGKIHNALLHDVKRNRGSDWDLGGEAEGGGDGHAGAGLDLHGEWLHVSIVNTSHTGVGSLCGKIFQYFEKKILFEHSPQKPYSSWSILMLLAETRTMVASNTISFIFFSDCGHS